MPAEDMNRRKDRVVSEARKVVENINAMSFVNLDDHQVHSLMMMREIARGIINNKLAKVTKSDVKKALSSSIEKMVGSCKDVNNILSRIPCEGMDDDQTHSVSRMKEIVSTIVSRRSKILGIRNRELLALEGVNAETAESKTGWAMIPINDDSEMGGIQRRLFENEPEQAMSLEYGPNEGIDIVLGNGDSGEQALMAAPPEGLMFDDVELVVEVDERNEEKREPENGGLEQMSEVRKLALVSPFRLTVVWPRDGKITLDWVKDMMAKLDQSSKKDAPSDFSSLMSSDVVDKLIGAASSILSKEPNCVEVNCFREDSRVIVVGDIEGHFHDLLNIFALAGFPSDNQFYVFNGNYVDRGAWGLEVFLVLLAWKVLMPNRVYLLRGNHETRVCTTMFGFEQEVKTKFGEQGERVYQKCLECFKELPLASVISKSVYTTHGGLFRSIGYMRRSKRKRSQFLDLGSLEDLPKVKRTLVDVSEVGPSILADILWSDPSKENGLVDNADKRLGLAWGPDCTEAFLRESKLKCIIRSHQGPDVRAGQEDFGDLLNGYSKDHVGESGKMFTLFSAPDYPQYGEPKYNNEGAYAVLKAPNFDTPSFHSFKAVRRPQLAAYGSSSPQVGFPTWMSSKADFEALGISNPPSFSVQFPDASGGIQAVEVPRASSVEGTPLPSDLQEPFKAAFEYLFELVAGLKHMISSRVIENGEPEEGVEGDAVNENEVEDTPSETGHESFHESLPENNISDEYQEHNIPSIMKVDEKEQGKAVPHEYEEMSVPSGISENNAPDDVNEGEISPKEGEAQEMILDLREVETQSVVDDREQEIAPKEAEVQEVEIATREVETQSVVGDMEQEIAPTEAETPSLMDDDEKEGEISPKEPETLTVLDDEKEEEISPKEPETQTILVEEKEEEISLKEPETQNVLDDEKERDISSSEKESQNVSGEEIEAEVVDSKAKEIPSKKEGDEISNAGEEETVSEQTEEAEIRSEEGEQKSSDETKEKSNADSENK